MLPDAQWRRGGAVELHRKPKLKVEGDIPAFLAIITGQSNHLGMNYHHAVLAVIHRLAQE